MNLEKPFSISAALFLSFFVFTFSISGDESHRINRNANRLFEEKRYEEALELYEDALLVNPAEPKIKMNKGSTHFKLNNFNSAIDLYSQALSCEDSSVAADAHYNLGNAFYRYGEQLNSAGDPRSREKFNQALENYLKALDFRADDTDAKWNLQLTHERIRELEEQQSLQQDHNQQIDGDDESEESQDSDDTREGEGEKEEEEDRTQDSSDPENQSERENFTHEEHQDNFDKEEASRVIEMFADDADDLHKPAQHRPAGTRRLEKDW
ncbi:aerotolerance regulator BatC [Chitinispirillum alkaliphilum]|nr:aerotolerance regulator BatC [Chitinispirillum alkaliphilum]